MTVQRKLRLNRRLVFIVFSVLSASSVCVLLAHQAQVAASIQNSRDLGLAAVEEQNWHQAVSQLRFYLDHKPDDIEALQACATALVDGYGELENAYDLYSHILNVDHYAHDARRQLAELAIQLERPDDATRHAKKLADRFPSDYDLQVLAGRVAEADNRPGDAIRIYTNVIRNKELHPQANQRLAVLYKVVHRNDVAATEAIDRLERSGDSSMDTLLTLSEFAFTEGRIDDASKQLTVAVTSHEANRQQMIRLIQLAVSLCEADAANGRTEIARILSKKLADPIQTAIDRQSESAFFDVSLARMQSHAGHHDDSLHTLQTALNRIPENLELRFQFAWQLIEAQKLDEARSIIDDLKKRDTNRSGGKAVKLANLLTATATLQEENFRDAAAQFQKLVADGIEPESAAPIAGRLEASCHEYLADWKAAADAWRRVVRYDPHSRSARLSLALTLMASDRYSEGVGLLSSIPRLGELLLSMDTDVSERDNRIVNRLRPKYCLARLFSDETRISSHCRRFLRALQHASREEFQQAHAELTANAEIHERLLDVVALTSSASTVEPRVIERIAKIDGGDARPLTAMLTTTSNMSDDDRLMALAQKRLSGLSEAEWVDSAGVIVSGVAGAARSLKASSPKRAANLDAFAAGVLSKMIKFDRGKIPQMVEFHSSAGRFDQAIESCRAAWNEMPERLAPLWLSAASRHADAAHQLETLQEHLVVHLGTPLESTRTNVNTAIGNKSKRARVQIVQADLYLMTGRTREAEEAYRQVLAVLPDQVNSLNNAAWLMSTRSAELPLAASFVQHAIDVVGNRADLLDTRGCVQLAQGDHQAAIDSFRLAVECGAGSDSLFHLAVALHKADDRDAAKRMLNAARKRGFDLSDVSPLEEHLVKVLEN